jgi:hypothetical protein
MFEKVKTIITNKTNYRTVLVWKIFLALTVLTSIFYHSLGFTLCLIAGYFKAIMDTLNFHYVDSIFDEKEDFQFWNPTVSWQNKYSNPVKKIRKVWRWGIRVPVMVTDGYHAAQGCMLMCLFGAMAYELCFGAVINWWADVIIMRTLFSVDFDLYYNLLFKK